MTTTLFEELSNWHRWGPDDTRGTLNLIGPEQVTRAASLIVHGVPVSCSRAVERPDGDGDADGAGAADSADSAPGTAGAAGVDEYEHVVVRSGEDAPATGAGVAVDRVTLACHGFTQTHLDSHAHMFWDRQMYNGRDAALCTTAAGASSGGVETAAASGIVGRGILYDGPRHRSKPWLEPGEPISDLDLRQWFAASGTEPCAGDVLFVRTGRDAWEAAGEEVERLGTGVPGLGLSALPWIKAHDIAVLVSDVGQGVAPSECEIPEPVHFVGGVGMGLWLVDNADLGRLSRACSAHHRYEFFTAIAPLAWSRATGSPVNPLAVL